MRSFVMTLLATVIAGSAAAADSTHLVIEVARSFKDGGGYKWESGTGSPREVRFAGQTILAAQKQGTYCSGYTFAVVMQAAEERGLLKGKTPDELRKFQKEWYGVPKDAQEMQCAMALERLGIGRRVKELSEARPGDFVQIWRSSKSGHSVVFLEWVREGEQVVGIKYRSSQGATDGIGDRVEYFSDAPDHEGKVLRERTYVGRLNDAPR